MNKDEHIKHLEDEILAARKTIAQLTKAIEELSKRQSYYAPPIYVQPYRYVGPYWTYTTGDVTYTSTVGTGTGGSYSISSYTINKLDDDEGDSGVSVAV